MVPKVTHGTDRVKNRWCDINCLSDTYSHGLISSLRSLVGWVYMWERLKFYHPHLYISKWLRGTDPVLLILNFAASILASSGPHPSHFAPHTSLIPYFKGTGTFNVKYDKRMSGSFTIAYSCIFTRNTSSIPPVRQRTLWWNIGTAHYSFRSWRVNMTIPPNLWPSLYI